jgi:hypothetical protein
MRSTIKKHTTPVEIGGTDWETVAAGQTDQVLGGTGAMNDLIARLVVQVTTVLTSNVELQDGDGVAFNVVPVNTPLGVYSIELGIRSSIGAWSVTTGAGASVLAIGQFSA